MIKKVVAIFFKDMVLLVLLFSFSIALTSVHNVIVVESRNTLFVVLEHLISVS